MELCFHYEVVFKMLPSQDSLLSSAPSSLEESSTEALQRRTIHGSAWIMSLPGDNTITETFAEPSGSTLSNFYYPWPTNSPGVNLDSGISVNGASSSGIVVDVSKQEGRCSKTSFKCANCDEEIEVEQNAERDHRVYWCTECQGLFFREFSICSNFLLLKSRDNVLKNCKFVFLTGKSMQA